MRNDSFSGQVRTSYLVPFVSKTLFLKFLHQLLLINLSVNYGLCNESKYRERIRHLAVSIVGNILSLSHKRFQPKKIVQSVIIYQAAPTSHLLKILAFCIVIMKNNSWSIREASWWCNLHQWIGMHVSSLSF